MVNEVGCSDFEDPLHNYSTSSLFPRTFRVSTDHHQNSSNDTNNIDSSHSCPNSPSSIYSFHSYLKSIALQSLKKLLEQTKAVLDRGSKLMNLNLTSLVPSEEEDKNEDVVVVAAAAGVAGKVEGNLRKRRPDLRLKRERPKFNFMADLSKYTVSSEPSLDMDKVAMEIEKLQDPEEYFLAHKRLERESQYNSERRRPKMHQKRRRQS